MKNIVITGSTRGIGFGLAKHFILNNHSVVISGRSEDGVKKAIKKLKEFNQNAIIKGFVCDTRFYKQVEALANFSVNELGSIDFWINNAGIDQVRKDVTDMEEDEYKKVIDTNITGVINGSKAALRVMKQQGHGQIFNMEGFGSDGMTMNKMSLYGTSKRAVRYFSRSLSKEVKKTSILIGRLSPGMVLTDLLLKPISKDDYEEKEQAKKIFNILADEVDTVTSYLSQKILKNKQNNAHIQWLTKRKMIYRFLTAPVTKRNVIK